MEQSPRGENVISKEWNTMISTEGDPPERDLQTEGNAMSTEGDPPGTRFTDRGECDVYWGGPPRNAIYRPRGMRCLLRGTPPERDLPTEGNAMSTEGDPPGTWFTDRGECDVYRGGPPRNAIYRLRGMRCLLRGTPPERDLPTEGNAMSTEGDPPGTRFTDGGERDRDF